MIKTATGIAQNYYPEMLYELKILNTPFVFRMVWGIAKTWLDKKTRKKIQMFKKVPTKELLKYIGLIFILFKKNSI